MTTPEEHRAVPEEKPAASKTADVVALEAEAAAIEPEDLDVPDAVAEAVVGGSASGSGAGKVPFDPFEITR
jgi:hypothetical protein